MGESVATFNHSLNGILFFYSTDKMYSTQMFVDVFSFLINTYDVNNARQCGN